MQIVTPTKQYDANPDIVYTTRIHEGIPSFTYLPRGREIIHRLIIRAAQCNSVEDLKLKRYPI